jgi:tRNA threonylcarbamoyladenosine biosynthesis protein TsaB
MTPSPAPEGLLLAFDTATAATVVGVRAPDGTVVTRRHDPGPGGRPGHTSELLVLACAALSDVGAQLGDVARLGVGVGPGSFTGLRIGVSTGRALLASTGATGFALSTLDALAWGPGGVAPRDAVLAVIDARRRETFVAGWRGGERVLEPAAVAPEALAARAADALIGAGPAVGDGAVRYREVLADAGIAVPPDDDPAHRVHGTALVALAAVAPPVDGPGLMPHYLRVPDVDLR